MPIKNYTTTISVEKTCMEIHAVLAKQEASAIMNEYDKERILTHLSFRLETPYGLMTFRLPANIDRFYAVLQKTDGVPRKLKTKEQAARVAWRVIKDWVHAQLALVEAEMVELPEVFLPYAQTQDGSTVFEKFKESPQFLLTQETHNT